MPKITFRDQVYATEPAETVLETLTRQGIVVPTSCRSGVCQTCAMVAQQGTPPQEAQVGLKSHLVEAGYFLACICRPREDMVIAFPDEAVHATASCTVKEKDWLSPTVIKLVLTPQSEFRFQPGQFINVRGPENISRCYSIASTPEQLPDICLHVRVFANGKLSPWLGELKTGDKIEISGPHGECYYRPNEPDRPLLLVSTGTGLAPQWAVLHEALAQQHHGPIEVFNASLNLDGLYYLDELQQLAQQHDNLHFTPCVAEGDDLPPGFERGLVNDLALARFPSLKGWRVYICGHPDMVRVFKRQAFLAGANLADIHVDPFEFSR